MEVTLSVLDSVQVTTLCEGGASGAAMIAGGLLAGALLVRREWGQPAPLFPIDLLRNRIFSMSIAASTVSFAAQMLAYVSLPFLFQMVLGRSAFETGLLMTPWPLALGVVAPIAGRLADKVRAGLLGGMGLAVFAAGLFSLSQLGSDPETWDIAWRMALCGAGFGLFQSPNNKVIITSAPRHRSGGASGMQSTARLTGQSLGAALVAVIFGLAHESGGNAGTGPAITAAIWCACALAALGAVASVLRRQPGG